MATEEEEQLPERVFRGIIAVLTCCKSRRRSDTPESAGIYTAPPKLPPKLFADDGAAVAKPAEDLPKSDVVIEHEGEDDGLNPDFIPKKMRGHEDFGNAGLDMSAKISKYSWDQSDKFVSIYVDYEGAGALAPEAVQVEFMVKGVLLTVQGSDKSYWFKIPNLCKAIDVKNSLKKVKTDSVVLKLRKLFIHSWSDISDEKDRAQEKREYRMSHGDLHGATREDLMADMYQNAPDEERARLRKANPRLQ